MSEDPFKKLNFLFFQVDITRIIIITGILLILLFFIITHFIAEKITEPIRSFTESAIKVTEGDLDQGVTINSYDELNSLGATFNIMIRKLRKQMVENECKIIREYEKRKNEKYADRFELSIGRKKQEICRWRILSLQQKQNPFMKG